MPANTIHSLRAYFPSLDPATDQITSPATDAYNCVAWAHHDTDRWWQRESWRPTFWPEELADDIQPANWVALFRQSGFKVCSSREFEPGYEKVAIYVSRDWREATDVARQMPSGCWTSKLGLLEDIEHVQLEALEGAEYGVVGIVMRRSIPQTTAQKEENPAGS